MEKVYLITGAAGHLGNTITRRLAESGSHIRALLLPNEKHIPENTEVFYGDVCDKESIRPFFENLEGKDIVVIHCAGIVSIATKFDQAVYDVNVTGTKNVVDLCKEYKVSKLIYVSTVHAIPEKPKGEVMTEVSRFDPEVAVGLYAKTKAEATNYVLDAAKEGLNATVVHPSGIVGPFDYGNGHLTALIIDFYKKRLTAGVKGGYDFVDVRDVAKGIIAAVEKGKPGECYILSNRYFKIREILDMLHEITGVKKVRTFLPIWFTKITATLSEIYYKIVKRPPLFTAYSIYTLDSNALFSHEKADRELGYTNRDMKETLKNTVDWLKEQGRI
ncbi:MAG TPA: NAD-dependent epimerase/dehydratase family protein [Erysipelotrichaceae bacterium]|nr:NAD-dependent epimerase/dehydratase family protein [Erysipelotrichaceae bacterium]